MLVGAIRASNASKPKTRKVKHAETAEFMQRNGEFSKSSAAFLSLRPLRSKLQQQHSELKRDMTTKDRDRWNEKYSQRKPSSDGAVDESLAEACGTIAKSSSGAVVPGRALDLACGLGQNSIWLAQQGWNVDGVDVSAEGLKIAQQSVTQHGCSVNWIEADLDDWLPTPDSYDLAIVFRFLDRETVPRIVTTGLRSGGWLIYETFSEGQLQRPDGHIRNPAFTLAPGELPKLFPEFNVVDYREECLDTRTVQRLLARRME
jgi:tellurite methyltransferase